VAFWRALCLKDLAFARCGLASSAKPEVTAGKARALLSGNYNMTLRLSPHTSVTGRLVQRSLSAFSLVEILIALTVLGTMSGGAFIAFNTINAYSVSSRLYTEAQAVAQNQVDLVLAKGPFDLTTTPQKVPAELELGTKVTPNVFIYRDPVTNQVLVTGTMTTEVTDAALSMTYGTATGGVTPTTALNVRRVRVTVSYAFRNKTYNVVMNVARTADA
jgi:type II secretory pathway pseudopilin PulG